METNATAPGSSHSHPQVTAHRQGYPVCPNCRQWYCGGCQPQTA